MSDSMQYGYWDRPNYKAQYLLETVGYVRRVWVEQEQTNDTVRFVLRTYYDDAGKYHDQLCVIFLDKNTTVAFAQLQLLRDAMDSLSGAGNKYPWMVLMHFNYKDESHEVAYVYHVEVRLPPEDGEYPITIQAIYGETTFWWYTHV